METDVLIYDDVYHWEGWGGRMRLGSGRCRLRIFDLRRGDQKGLAHLKPFIAVVSDLPKERINDMSVRSCTGHVATCVAVDFKIDPQRMLWVEYTLGDAYGAGGNRRVAESVVAVDFKWHDAKAIEPRWRELVSPLRDAVLELIHRTENTDRFPPF
ncbi:MAG: hypothetical protein RBR20_13400 [Desulfobacterales bacterium]|jgi:hypothetical protein|nr:hypothetical protein [Desulfobacteraceae bacterium]MDD3991502.1 hypothetical protein [Desulfobacteraceae bacterium]MDY0313104.1 hypothetical protein [Desulfobacterales bacterium]